MTYEVLHARYQKARARLAAARTDEERDRALSALDRVSEALDRHVEAQQRRTMTKQKFEAAMAVLTNDLAAAVAAMKQLEARKRELPPAYYSERHAQLKREVRIAGDRAAEAAREYQIAAVAEARRQRSAAEASIDPARRVALMDEAQRLADSGINAEVMLESARQMQEDGQPERAAMYLSAARRISGRPSLGQALNLDIEAALDEAIPARKAAAEIEREVESNLAALGVARKRALTEAQIGILPDGRAGTGSSEDVTRANVARKMEAFHHGLDFSDPVTAE